MSTAVSSSVHAPRAATALAALASLALAACVHSNPKQAVRTHDAAADNTQLGIAYMNQGDLELAKLKLDRALSEDPNNPGVHSARAILFARLREPEKADAEFRTALRLAPHDPNVINNYAAYLCANGRTEEGVKRFLEAAHNPIYRDPQGAYTNAGVCLHSAKRDDEARTNFLNALQLRPNYAEAAYQLATLEFEQGQLAAARARIDTFVGTYTATPDLLLLGVRVARAQRDVVAEKRYARRLTLDFPGSDQARALASLDHNPG
jgi:type IV pilus assembly protein PilF